MSIKRTKAVEIVSSIIDEGGTDLTHSDITYMKDADLFMHLELWGYYWNGREWIDGSN